MSEGSCLGGELALEVAEMCKDCPDDESGCGAAYLPLLNFVRFLLPNTFAVRARACGSWFRVQGRTALQGARVLAHPMTLRDVKLLIPLKCGDALRVMLDTAKVPNS